MSDNEGKEQSSSSENSSLVILADTENNDNFQIVDEASEQKPQEERPNFGDNNSILTATNDEDLQKTVKLDNSENLNQNCYDVIVVGAGISGLSAAYYLKKSSPNLKILILEAKDRVGGRTQTVEMKSSEDGQKAKWDLGGQWVTDTQKNITKIINELGLETYTQFVTGKKILEGKGKVVTYDFSIPKISLFGLLDLQLMISKTNSNAKKVSSLNPFENIELAKRLDKITLDNFVFSKSFSSSSKSIIEAAIRTTYGLELNQINALFGLMYINSAGGDINSLLLADPGCAQEKKVKGGTQQISEKLLEKVLSHSKEDKFVLNEALVEVKQNVQSDNELVSVVTQSTQTKEYKEYKAKRVISSIPINQYVHVKFEPDLPAYKKNLIKFSSMGNLTKFIITYKDAFWRKKGYSGEVISDGVHNANSTNLESPKLGPITCLFDATTSNNEAALVGFRGGKIAVEWEDTDATYCRDQTIETLCKYFGNEARDYLDYKEKNWNLEAFSGGCPVVNVTTGDVMEDYIRATREPLHKVHFCGTESASVWQGYMDGAVESGERVANEVLYSIFKENTAAMKIDYEKTYYFYAEKMKYQQQLQNK